MAQWLTIKNWAEFQHYKDRNPPWIKLHRSLLDDYAFAALPDHQKAHLVLLWLFAASQDGGRIPNDAAFLSRKLGTTEPMDLETLVNSGFLVLEQNASDVIAVRKQGASKPLALTRSRESETETETEKTSCAIRSHGKDEKADPDGFAECWNAYPKRTGGNSRKEAVTAYRARIKTGVLPADLLAGVQRYATFIRATGKEGSAFVKQAASFFGPAEHWNEPWDAPLDAGHAGSEAGNPFRGAI